MFEEMGEACAARPLVLRADVIPDVYSDDRRGMVFVQDDLQAVGERVPIELQFGNLRHGFSWRGEEGGGEEDGATEGGEIQGRCQLEHRTFQGFVMEV